MSVPHLYWPDPKAGVGLVPARTACGVRVSLRLIALGIADRPAFKVDDAPGLCLKCRRTKLAHRGNFYGAARAPRWATQGYHYDSDARLGLALEEPVS